VFTSLLSVPAVYQSCDNNTNGHIKGAGFLENEVITDVRGHDKTSTNTVVKLPNETYDTTIFKNEHNNKTGYKTLRGVFGEFKDSIPGVPPVLKTIDGPYYDTFHGSVIVKDTTVKENYNTNASKFKWLTWQTN